MRKLAAALLAAMAAPATAIPPPLPPPDQFEFYVDGVTISCRLPQPAGPLTGCMLQYSLYLLSVRMHRQADGSFRYYATRNCLEPGPHTQGFEFANRDGTLTAASTLPGSTLERDLRALLEMRSKTECEAIANWPHQLTQIMPRLERAFVVYRSLAFQ